MREIRGILFDKDGTLLNFHTFWPPIVQEVIDLLLEQIGGQKNDLLKEELLKRIGYVNHQIEEYGILASGTTKDLADAIQNVLGNRSVYESRMDLEAWLSAQLRRLTRHNLYRIQPTASFYPLFQRLKGEKIRVGLSTADDYVTTILSLKQLGIYSFFDFIGTSDRYKGKPDPDMFFSFCKKFGLEPSEVAVVGDTITDLLFARNSGAGLVIGVLSGVGNEEVLAKEADILLPSVSGLIRADGRFIWEESDR